MVVASNAPARKQNLSGTVIIPREIADLPYFAKEKRVFSRQDALAWIATHVRYVDNCTLKRWQETWSLRYLADAWGWTVKRVRCFLEKLEKWGIIGTTLGKVKGTAQIVITYMVQRLDWSSESNGAQQGHSKGTARAQSKERQEGKEEDSCSPQASNAFKPDPMFMPDEDEPEADQATGAGPSDEAPGAGQSETPECGSAASVDADLPKNSAQKGSGRRADLDSPRCRGTSQRQLAGEGYPAEFEQLWLKIPKAGRRGGKAKPFEIWKRASAEVRRQIEVGVEAWAKRDGDRTEFVPMAQTWFNQRRWETEIELADGDRAKQGDYSRQMDELYA